jgi:hypothetical protein
MFISQDFLKNLPPRRMRILQRSFKLLKVAAKATAIRGIATPSQAFLKLSWSRLWHSSPHFDFLK